MKNDENVCFIEPETIMEDSDKAMITAEDKRQQEIANSITAKPIDNPETKYKLLVVEDHADIRLYLRVLFLPPIILLWRKWGRRSKNGT